MEPLLPSAGTLFVFPFDHDTVPAAVAVREIAAALTAIQPRILLFLTNIERLRVGGAGVAESVIERSVAERGRRGASRDAVQTAAAEEWLVWHRRVEGLTRERIEIAFRLEAGRIVPVADSPLTVFFPTQKETFLGFLIQGPYRTTPAATTSPDMTRRTRRWYTRPPRCSPTCCGNCATTACSRWRPCRRCRWTPRASRLTPCSARYSTRWATR